MAAITVSPNEVELDAHTLEKTRRIHWKKYRKEVVGKFNGGLQLANVFHLIFSSDAELSFHLVFNFFVIILFNLIIIILFNLIIINFI